MNGPVFFILVGATPSMQFVFTVGNGSLPGMASVRAWRVAPYSLAFLPNDSGKPSEGIRQSFPRFRPNLPRVLSNPSEGLKISSEETTKPQIHRAKG